MFYEHAWVGLRLRSRSRSACPLGKRKRMEILRKLFGSDGFMPQGMCYLWNTRLIYLHVISDSLIALSYFAIPVILLWFVRKRRNVPFGWTFGFFGLFIMACGSTHLMEVWNLWHGDYWLSGIIKAITAAMSVATAILLVRVIPKAIDLPDPARWIKANAALEEEVHKRREIELDLRTSEANYRAQAELLDLTHDAIFVRDMQDKIIYWNRACAERLYGWRSAEACGQVARELLQKRLPVSLAQIEAGVRAQGILGRRNRSSISQRRRDRCVEPLGSAHQLFRPASLHPRIQPRHHAAEGRGTKVPQSPRIGSRRDGNCGSRRAGADHQRTNRASLRLLARGTHRQACRDARAPALSRPASGTTGAAKGAMHTHRSLVCSAMHFMATWPFDQQRGGSWPRRCSIPAGYSRRWPPSGPAGPTSSCPGSTPT